jgi:hypothetical protein
VFANLVWKGKLKNILEIHDIKSSLLPWTLTAEHLLMACFVLQDFIYASRYY